MICAYEVERVPAHLKKKNYSCVYQDSAAHLTGRKVVMAQYCGCFSQYGGWYLTTPPPITVETQGQKKCGNRILPNKRPGRF